MSARPFSVTLGNGLIVLTALMWFGLGLILLTDLHPALPDSIVIKGMLASFSFGMSGILLLLLMFLVRKNRIAYFLMVALLFGNSLLTLLDQFGWVDLIALLLHLFPAFLLVINAAWYLRRNQPPDEESRTLQ